MKKLVGELWQTYLKPFLDAAVAKRGKPASPEVPEAKPPEAKPSPPKPKPLDGLRPQRQIRTLTFLVETYHANRPCEYRFKVDLANDGIWIRNADEGMLAGRMRARINAKPMSEGACHVTVVEDETGRFAVPVRPPFNKK